MGGLSAFCRSVATRAAVHPASREPRLRVSTAVRPFLYGSPALLRLSPAVTSRHLSDPPYPASEERWDQTPTHGVPTTEEHVMTGMASTYSPSIAAAVAREHDNELLRDAAASRATSKLPLRDRHRTPRRRAHWWLPVIARSATPLTA